MEDTKIIKEKITKEINNNQRQIQEINKKKLIIDSNNTEHKITRLLLFFCIAMFLSMGISLTLLKNIINLEEFIKIIIPISGIVSFNTEIIFSAKLKEKLKEISDAKTNKELIEESIKYNIEKSKLLNKNQVLHNLRNNLYKYNITEETLKNINLSLQEKEVNDLTIKNVLEKKFKDFRDKSKITANIRGLSTILGFCGIAISVPYIFSASLSTIAELALLLASSIAGIAIGAIYETKRSKDNLLVFKKLNHELLNDEMPLNSKDDETNYEEKIEKIINDILKKEKEKIKIEIEKTPEKNNKENFSYHYNPNSITKTDNIPKEISNNHIKKLKKDNNN